MVGTVYRSLVIGLLTAAVMLLARPWVVPSRSSGDNADRLAVVDVDRAAAGDGPTAEAAPGARPAAPITVGGGGRDRRGGGEQASGEVQAHEARAQQPAGRRRSSGSVVSP